MKMTNGNSKHKGQLIHAHGGNRLGPHNNGPATFSFVNL